MVKRLVDSRRTLRVPALFGGQRLPLPLVPANQEQLRREAGLFSGAMSLTIPHRRHCRELGGCILKRLYFEERRSQNSE